MHEHDALPNKPIEPATPGAPSTAGLAAQQNSVFTGPNGLRAGWRLLIFVAVACLVAFVLGLILHFSLGGQNRAVAMTMLTPFGLGVSEATILFVVLIATLVMGRIEHRHFGAYGLPLGKALGLEFWQGALIGFLAISGTLLVIFFLHGFRFTGFAIHGATIVSATAAWSLTFLIVGLSEEFTFRGYTMFTLTTGMGFWPASFVVAGLFALAHAGNKGETAFGLVSVAFFSLLFCLFLQRTGDLWLAVGFHAGWDWGQTFFYGVPDSGVPAYHNLLSSTFSGPTWLTGGSVGPEASVFTPAALAIVAILFSRVYGEHKYRTISAVRSRVVESVVPSPS